MNCQLAGNELELTDPGPTVLPIFVRHLSLNHSIDNIEGRGIYDLSLFFIVQYGHIW